MLPLPHPLGPNEPQPDKYATKDHLIPKAAGGALAVSSGNVVAACRACNQLRGMYNTGMWFKHRCELNTVIAEQRKQLKEVRAENTVLKKDLECASRFIFRTVVKPWWVRVAEYLKGEQEKPPFPQWIVDLWDRGVFPVNGNRKEWCSGD